MLFRKEPRKSGPNDWGQAVVVNPKEIAELQASLKFTQKFNNVLVVVCVLLFSTNMLSLVYSRFLDKQKNAATRAAGILEKHLAECKKKERISSSALDALSRSHTSVLNATKQVREVEGSSWGRRFRITQYVPSAGGINADSDNTTTATMWKADPKLRIVAVDPTLIPFGSKVWVEGFGWYQAQDSGGGIKGYRIDVMGNSMEAAKKFGVQERFVIVVPPSKT